VLNADHAWRFHCTIKQAVDFGEVWFACDSAGALQDLKVDETWFTTFWPHEDIGVMACQQWKKSFDIEPMPLNHWIDEILDKSCRSDGCLVGLCPTKFGTISMPVDDVIALLVEYKTNPAAYWDLHFRGDVVKVVAMGPKAGPRGRLP
jgi:hypothetical protein